MRASQHSLPEYSTSMRPVFRDPVHQDHFDRFGWVKVPFLSSDEIRNIECRSRDIVSNFPDGFNVTILMSQKIKAATYEIVRSVFRPHIDALLQVDYRMISSSIIGKSGYGKGNLPLHQHLNFMDETKSLPQLIIWCPLIDTDESNGNLHVVSGTHRLPRFPRAHTEVEVLSTSLYSAACWRLFNERIEAVPAKAGEAIVFDNSLLHGSPPILSDKTRIAVSTVLVPVEMVPLMYFPEEDGRLAICAIDEDYLLEHPLNGEKPDTLLGYIDMPNLDGLEKQVFQALGMEPPETSSQQTSDVIGKTGIFSWMKRFLTSGG